MKTVEVAIPLTIPPLQAYTSGHVYLASLWSVLVGAWYAKDIVLPVPGDPRLSSRVDRREGSQSHLHNLHSRCRSAGEMY